MYSKKAIAIFFLLLVSSTFLMSFLSAAAVEESRKVAKSGGGGKKAGRKGRKSATDYLDDVMDIASAFGGDAVANILRELLDQLEHTSNMLKSLAKDDVLSSINFAINTSITSLGDASRSVASKNDLSDTVQSSDFGEFVDEFKTTLLKRCRAKANFSPLILPQLEAALPMLLQSVAEMYGNVVSSIGFGLTFNMLEKGTSALSMIQAKEYVTADTFKSFANFPTDFKHQMETMFDEVVGQYIDPAQLDMILGMARMAASNFATRRGEHDEL